MACAILGLACLAADRGDWPRATALHGAAQALLDPTGETWQDPEARYRRDSLGRLRAPLGVEQFDLLYAHGTALSFEQALDAALAERGFMRGL